VEVSLALVVTKVEAASFSRTVAARLWASTGRGVERKSAHSFSAGVDVACEQRFKLVTDRCVQGGRPQHAQVGRRALQPNGSRKPARRPRPSLSTHSPLLGREPCEPKDKTSKRDVGAARYIRPAPRLGPLVCNGCGKTGWLVRNGKITERIRMPMA